LPLNDVIEASSIFPGQMNRSCATSSSSVTQIASESLRARTTRTARAYADPAGPLAVTSPLS